jgi:hypothetical protein
MGCGIVVVVVEVEVVVEALVSKSNVQETVRRIINGKNGKYFFTPLPLTRNF